MENTRNVKAAMLAAGSLLAAAAAFAPAHAADFDQAAYPAVIEAPMAAAAIDHGDQKAQMPAKRIALLAVAAGALAGLIRLIGAKKIVRAAKETAVAAVKVSGKAVKAVSRAVASPLRFALLMAGLALFALTGVGLYDIEWIGGLVAGAAMAGLAAYGAMKARMSLKPRPIRIHKSEVVNGD